MLTVRVICVGTLKEKYWREACGEYAKRLSAFCNFSIVELPEARPGEAKALIDRALEEEGKGILAAVGSSAVVPLCIEGRKISSKGLSQMLGEFALRGQSAVSFVIGSSHGLSGTVKARGRGISMSDMTFPHQLARVMLCEQIYRAFQIEAGTKYHK